MVPPRRPLRDNPRLILAGMIRPARRARRHRRARQQVGRPVSRFPHRIRPVRPVGGRPHDPARPHLRARAQCHQAHRRAAASAAVRAIPRKARRRAARHDADSRRAGAARGQRADSEQRRSLVQRAGRGCADVGRSRLRATTTAIGRRASRPTRSDWPARWRAPRSTAPTSAPCAIASCRRSRRDA